MAKVEDGLARFYALSDGIFAVIITVMVLAFKSPTGRDFPALLSPWPDLVSYAVSYAFIAVVWLNHHEVLRYAQRLTHLLIHNSTLPGNDDGVTKLSEGGC